VELVCIADSENQIYTREKQLAPATSSQTFQVKNLRRQKVRTYMLTLRHVTDFVASLSGDILALLNTVRLKIRCSITKGVGNDIHERLYRPEPF
jgi:hypothetical protein